MATGNHISCGPCMFDDVTKDAGRWCTNCEEGLCEDCENVHRKGKTTRNHRVISIEDYRKIEHVSISQVCEHHGENLEWLCKSHDEVLCVVCVPSKHNACSDVIPISVNSADSRQSTAFSDLEETINGTLRNVKQCIKNRESASNELEKQELEIKTMFHETRTNINSHLDKLQEKLLYELRSSSDTCKSKYIKLLQKLKSTEEMLTKVREQTTHMKQFSSDIQVFLGTRQVSRQIVREVESIKSEFDATKDYELKVSMHSLITKLSNDVEEFGKIMVSESATNFDLRAQKFDQAQMKINVQRSRSISDIQLQLIRSFQIKSKNEISVIGYIILPNRNLLIANKKDNHLIEYSDTGEHIRDIPVSSKPYGIAVIDPDRIVVTYEEYSYIEIMNYENFNVQKNFRLPKNHYKSLKV
ncbi:putative leucine-rich repeat-containing protein DDB_G0290503 [Mytilus edulis]|uniref:putative leucine-rich repeat-containing protein DDB_G0290503 n=1 Tax=Mytilus edulis TaxID=6550 RepID=UPI0039EFADFA